MTKCVIYARFSPRPDMETSDSADKQFELCRDYAAKRGYEIVGEYKDEGASRNDMARMGLAEAIESLRRGYVLLCYELSRFGAGGEAVALERQIQGRGASVEFVQGFHVSNSPDTKLIRDIMYAIKEYERQMIGARTQVRMLMHQRAGRPMSKLPPYGYTIVESGGQKRLVPCEDEQVAAVTMLQMHKAGLTTVEIVKALEKSLGAKGRRGDKWSRTTVYRVLKRSGEYDPDRTKNAKMDRNSNRDKPDAGTL
jgi:site-specific DNA recombinase